jgi:hypothetical protein
MISTLALLAQAGPPSDGIPPTVLMFLGTICVVGFLITITVIGIKYATHERDLLHAERLKAIEKGILLDDVEDERRFRKGLLRLAFSIGVVVPICAAGAATGALSAMGSGVAGISVFLICSAAAAVGVAGVASGAWLALAIMTRFNSTARRTSQTPSSPATSPYPRTYDAPEAATAMR